MDRVNMAPGEMQVEVDLQIVSDDFRKQAQFEVEVALISAELWKVQTQKKCNLDVYTE